MNCDKCTDLISAYIDGELDTQSIQAVKEHLDKCVECKSLYNEMSTLTETASLFADVAVPDELMTRVMSSVGNSKPTVHKTIVIPAWVTNWKVYSSVAACLLAVLLIRGGVDKKYQSYTSENYNYTYKNELVNNDNTQKDDTTEILPSATPDVAVQSPQPDATSTVTADDAITSNQPDVRTIEPANPDIALAEATVQNDAAAYTPPEDTGTSKARMAKDTDADDHAYSSGSSAGGGGGAGGAGGGSAGGAIRSGSSSIDSKKLLLLSKYNFSENYAMVETQITFKIINPQDTATAAEIFAANSSKGVAAVESAFEAAGISFKTNLPVVTNHSLHYNALVRQGNDLKEQLKNATDAKTIDDIAKQLADIQSQIDAITKRCSTVQLVLK